MHELAVCQALMRRLEALAREHEATRIVRVTVRIGPLSGVEPDLLRRAWPVASAGSSAAAAELALERAPVRVRCLACGDECECAVNRLVCDRCGSWRTALTSGQELELRQVELDGCNDSGMMQGEACHV